MFPTYALTTLALASLVLVLAIPLRRAAAQSRAGKIATFGALFVLPVLVTAFGTGSHLEHSKSTQFCLSCHEMEPYGRSLRIEDSEFLPASHFQNRRVDTETACFDCHTTYTMYGDLSAKLKGLRHVWVHFSGSIPTKIELYDPYSNRECLYCHAGARSFEESELHADLREDLAGDATSCLECHDLVHAIDGLADENLWNPPQFDGESDV